MKIKIHNSTAYPTRELRALVRAAVQNSGGSSRDLTVWVRSWRSKRVAMAAATLAIWLLWLPKNDKHLVLADLARLLHRGCLMRRGVVDRDMTPEQRYPFGHSLPAWCPIQKLCAMSRTKPSEVRSPEGRRAAARERAARRERRMRERLDAWLTKLRHAEKKVAKYRKKVRYYDRDAKRRVKPKSAAQTAAVALSLRRGRTLFDEGTDK